MGKTHLVIPDSHAHYKHNNDRAVWLGKLILDVKPDEVIHIGDSADMPSLSGYDKGKKTFQGRTYRADIDAHLDFQDKLWSTVRSAKKKLPHTTFCIGNHEERIGRALDLQPELEGAIGYGDLKLNEWYDNVVHYEGNTPGVAVVDGIHYAHYFISGISGRPLSSIHHAYALISKKYVSCTTGHTHLADYYVSTAANGKKIMGLVSGCYQDYDSDWAGASNGLWWRGVVIKRNVSEGQYDPEFVSLNTIKKLYS